MIRCIQQVILQDAKVIIYQAEKFPYCLPDQYRHAEALYDILTAPESLVFNISNGGVVHIRDLGEGVWEIHTILWTEEARRQDKRAFLQSLFNTGEIRKLTTAIPVENRKAIQVASKLGFQSTGLLQQHTYFAGIPRDLIIMEMLRKD